jgi:hypothetical protein
MIGPKKLNLTQRWMLFATDDVVKGVFDHVRNLGICAAVFGAAAWKWRNMPATGLAHYMDFAITGVLAAFGIWLFFLNQVHGIVKLDRAGASPRIIAFVQLTYSAIAVSVIGSLTIR